MNRMYDISATELKNNLGKYLDMVRASDHVVISKNGRKIARLSPYVSDYEQYQAVQESAGYYGMDREQVTYEEFMAIYDKSTVRMEYIDGEIYVLASPSVTHQSILGDLYLIFRNYLKGKSCDVFLAPFDVHFWKKDDDRPDVCQPDLLIACDLEEEGVVTAKDRYMGTPALVVEILSPGTRSKDMVKKLNTYMLSGVKEYMVFDPAQQHMILYCFEACEIVSVQFFKPGDTAVSVNFEGLAIEVADVLG